MRATRGLLGVALTAGLLIVAGCTRAGGPSKGAEALGLRVRLELLQKLGVDGLRVDVEAEGGRVVLSGEVKKRSTAELAETVAHQVEGVSAVTNRIRVAGGPVPENKLDAALAEAQHQLDDAALATRVRLALVDRMGSDGFRIGTQAASGVVTLEFPRRMESGRRREARGVAERLPGVTRVVSLEKD